MPPALLILADRRQGLRNEGGEGALITCINGFPGGEGIAAFAARTICSVERTGHEIRAPNNHPHRTLPEHL